MLQEKELENLALAKNKQRKSIVRRLLACLVCLAVAGGLGWWGWQTYTASQAQMSARKNLDKAKLGAIDVRVTATGMIRPFNQVKISPKLTGLLKELYVQQGSIVKKGQLIAAMDDSNLVGQVEAARAAYLGARSSYEKALHGSRPQEVADSRSQVLKTENMVRYGNQAVTSSRANLKAAKAQVVRDETNWHRMVQLAAQGAVSDQDRLNSATQAEVSQAQLQKAEEDVKQAESSLAQSYAELESARQRFSMCKEGYRQEDVKAAQEAMMQSEGTLKFLESQLNDTRIRAPFDGVITQKYTDIGAIVAPTTASMTNSATSSSIVSLAGRLEMVAQVSETDIENIKLGQEVEIRAGAYPDKVFHGHVTLLAPEAILTQNVTTFEVHTSIDDDAHHFLMSGMNINAEFIAGKKDGVILIPTVAVVTKKGKIGVFAPDKSGNPEFKPIKIGTSSDTQTVVLSGLSPGDDIFIGLTKDQLVEQGYSEKSLLGSGSHDQHKPEVPRGMRNKL